MVEADVTTTVVVNVGLAGGMECEPPEARPDGEVAALHVLPAVECCDDDGAPLPHSERDPALLLANGDMAEHLFLDRRPMESWRSLSRSRSA